MTARRKNSQSKASPTPQRGRSRRKVEPNTSHFKTADRRVHLVLTRTGPHGAHQLQLGRAIFEHDWQNRLALASANSAFSALQADFSLETIAKLAEHALVSVSSLISHLLNAAQPAISCAGGCNHCCHQRVGVTPVEAIAIALHVRETTTPGELDELRLSLAAFVERTRALSGAERYSPAYACPLLKDQLCSIYPVRPLSCRGVHSFDQKACENELRDPLVRQAFLRGELPGHSFREPVQAVYAVSAGLQLALHEQFALDMQPLDLAQALHELLRSEEALSVAQQWLDGLPALFHARTDVGPMEGLNAVLKQDLGLAAPR